MTTERAARLLADSLVAAMTIHVDIVSAEAEIFSDCAEMVIVPGIRGDLGILPRHAPLLTCLRPGQVRLVECEGKREELFYVSGGLLEVQPYLVTILSDTALRARDIDEARALEAKRRAEQMLRERSEECDCAPSPGGACAGDGAAARP